ncbi:MAG: thioredoxin domain-containing protein [Pseudanabaenaceae cyanobacterium]
MNQLAHCQSLYLRKHAHNPIHWQPWGEEAIGSARRQNKPIFVSIGYSSCHWCTVMEGEAFSDPTVADYLNAHFVAIKLDREERPDLDSLYMQAVQVMGEQGGWPLNLFLTPDDLVPFYGGTYFPLEPRYGRPGFLRVLQGIVQIYRERQGELQAYRQQILAQLQALTALKPTAGVGVAALRHGLQEAGKLVMNRDRGTCFPMIPYARLALQGSRLEPELLARAKQRGLDLALGGIFDHVAGGWHRYTVDPTWTVPHFEKMLYDNGLNLQFLAELWLAGFPDAAIARAVRQTVGWLQREMLDGDGLFYASQDADCEGQEGKFWVWRYSELQQVLTGPELQLLSHEFTVTPEGNFEGKNVLQRRRGGDLSADTEAILLKLFRVRYGPHSLPEDAFPPARSAEEAKEMPWPGRVPPVTDTKIIVSWNALVISGLAACYRAFPVNRYLQLAIDAADALWRRQIVNNRLHRLNYDGRPAIPAQAEDYAFLIAALLDLHLASCELGTVYLERAIALQTEFDGLLWDPQTGGYFNTAADAATGLLLREKSYQDGATPSPNGVALTNLVRLGALTGETYYLDRAEKGLQAFGEAIAQMAAACPSLVGALDWLRHFTTVKAPVATWLRLQTTYQPTAIATVTTNPEAIVCPGLTCQPPVTTWEELQTQLAKAQQRAFAP